MPNGTGEGGKMRKTRTENIIVRLSEIEKKAWTQTAEQKGVSLSEFIRFTVNSQIERDKEIVDLK